MTTPVFTDEPRTPSGQGGIDQQVHRALSAHPNKMTSMLARELGVPEVHVIRALPAGQTTALDPSRWQELVRRFESLGDVRVILSNASGTLECEGAFGNFSITGSYFNVQTATIDMHLLAQGVAHVFAVEKPSHMDDVKVQSFQFYGPQGHSAFKVFLSFGGKPVDPDRQARFDSLRNEFALPSSPQA